MSSAFDIDRGWAEERDRAIIPILKPLYPEARFEKTIGGGEVDKELSGDLKVIFPNKTEIWAHKLRRKKYYKKHGVTIEIMNGDGTRGDWYRFVGGVVKKYVYGWCDNGNILELLVLDVAELIKISTDFFDGNLEREFPGGLKIKCFQNLEHGRSFFTVINVESILLCFPEVIEKRWRAES